MRRIRPLTSHRRGLAPAELVLVLPLMMLVAGLMLFVANAGVWKLRAHAAAREAAFQSVQPRSDVALAQPPEWRRPDVTFQTKPGSTIWPTDPFANHTLFRGPAWDWLQVDPQLLDGSTGAIVGEATSAIASGLWPQMHITYRFTRQVSILGHQLWGYQEMGFPNHEFRRSLRLFSPDSNSL